jgi:hypothetical protein
MRGGIIKDVASNDMSTLDGVKQDNEDEDVDEEEEELLVIGRS